MDVWLAQTFGATPTKFLPWMRWWRRSQHSPVSYLRPNRWSRRTWARRRRQSPTRGQAHTASTRSNPSSAWRRAADVRPIRSGCCGAGPTTFSVLGLGRGTPPTPAATLCPGAVRSASAPFSRASPSTPTWNCRRFALLSLFQFQWTGNIQGV